MSIMAFTQAQSVPVPAPCSARRRPSERVEQAQIAGQRDIETKEPACRLRQAVDIARRQDDVLPTSNCSNCTVSGPFRVSGTPKMRMRCARRRV
jgi:hypothetical protein